MFGGCINGVVLGHTKFSTVLEIDSLGEVAKAQ